MNGVNGNGKKGGRKSPNCAQPNANNANRRRKANGNSLQASSVSYSGAAANFRPVINSVQTMSGSDFFATIEVQPDVSGIGRIIAKVPISPSQYPGTRLTQLSNLWEFFKFTKFHLRWVPAVPTTLACQFVLYIDLDPSDDPSLIANEDALIRQAVAQTGAQQWNFHVPKTIPLAMRNDRQYYFTGVDKQNIRFSQQGAAYLIQITNPINFNGENISNALQAGSLFIDWTVNFSTPQLNPSAAVVSITSQEQVNARITTTDLVSTLESGTNQYIIDGFLPRRFYGVSLAAQSDSGTVSLRVPQADGSLGANMAYCGCDATPPKTNYTSPNTPIPGYVILQADNSGSISVIVSSTTVGSDFEACLLVYMPLLEETATVTTRQVRTVRQLVA